MGKKKVKKEKAIIIIILVIIVASALSYTFYNQVRPNDVKVIDMRLNVGNYTGFDVNTSLLIFGTVVPGGSAKRTINIENIAEEEQKVEIVAEGELADWSYLSKNHFNLQTYEITSVDVTLYVPENATFGNYKGTLEILFR